MFRTVLRSVLIGGGILALLGGLAPQSIAATLSLKCSFQGLIPQEILYVINAEAKEVSVIGDFGTHKGVLLNYGEGYYYVLEPNKGASVSTILYVQAGDTPVGIRSTLGQLPKETYNGIPETLRLASDKMFFMGVFARGRCPVQR